MRRWRRGRGLLRRGRRGFTLVEIMVVVVIMGIAAGVALPVFVGSFRGAKLRVASRTIAMASRFARSTAVLQGQHMAILFFPDHGEIELVRLQTRPDRSEQSMFLEGRGQRRVSGLLDGGGTPPGPDAAPASLATEMVRRLPEGIRMVQVKVGAAGTDAGTPGGYWVAFYPNGMSERFEVTLEDDAGRLAVVSIDPISGKVRIEHD